VEAMNINPEKMSAYFTILITADAFEFLCAPEAENNHYIY
jgi:hypothetical protein